MRGNSKEDVAMVQGIEGSYSGTELLAVGEHALANYNAWIVKQFVRYFRSSDTAGKAVLDFGAGIGTLSVIFERDSGVRPLAVEVDTNQQVALRNRNIETYSSLADLSRPMDFIYSSNVLEHIADDVAALAALWDTLVVGGKIAIFVPAFESIWTTNDDHVGHHRRYTMTSLKEKLVAAGFEVESIKYCDSLGFLLAFLYKFIGDASGEPSGTSLKIFDRAVFPVSLVVDRMTSRLFGKNVLALARRL
jgi:predicted SAM-dependent methyltransferase